MAGSFLTHSQPMIAGIMAAHTPQELIAEARNAEFDGAHGITVDLAVLKPEFRNVESFKGLIDSVNLPFMFYFYRDDRWGDPSDEGRQEVLLSAADAGAAMIDVMGDLYHPSPMEITYDPQAIDKQKRLIDTIHDKGAEVVISSHMACPRTADEVLAHLQEVERRGADVVKIVHAANTDEELAEAVRTTMVLKRELKTPFIHLCSGAFSRPHRFLGPSLGVSITFAVHRYDTLYGGTQPTIRSLKAVLDNLHWNINNV